MSGVAEGERKKNPNKHCAVSVAPALHTPSTVSLRCNIEKIGRV